MNLDGRQIYIHLCNEKLPRMCFRCNCIAHHVKGCSKVDEGKGARRKGMINLVSG